MDESSVMDATDAVVQESFVVSNYNSLPYQASAVVIRQKASTEWTGVVGDG